MASLNRRSVRCDAAFFREFMQDGTPSGFVNLASRAFSKMMYIKAFDCPLAVNDWL
jgi:hypothetical protein